MVLAVVILAERAVVAHSDPLSSENSTSVSLPCGELLELFRLLPHPCDHPRSSKGSRDEPSEPFRFDFMDDSLEGSMGERKLKSPEERLFSLFKKTNSEKNTFYSLDKHYLKYSENVLFLGKNSILIKCA